MPVPIPRQRAIPAAESGQAQGAFSPGGPSGEATGGPAGAAPAPHAATTPVDSTTNLTLLVIEDDPAGSLSVPEMLDAAGKPIRIRTARNLTEAERLLTDDVHCILLDLALPAPAGRPPRATTS